MRQRLSVPDDLADEDDVDAPGQLGVNLKELPDGAVLAVGRLRPGVLEHQAVLVDPVRAAARWGTSFCAPATKITLAAPQA